MKPPVVGLLTDFGTKDFYSAAMKAVILNFAPTARIVDISHEIPAQDVRSGAFQLFSCFKDFPRGTFFIGVVDPGVGTKRRILYGESGGHKFIAPDNGLLSWVFAAEPPQRVFSLSSRGLKLVSGTFHGRDIMAPIAGQILAGKKPENFGERVSQWKKIPFPELKKSGSKWIGEILLADSFGNLITNFKAEDLNSMKSAKLWFELGKGRASVRGLSGSYSDVPKGKILAIKGSSGFIEISVRDGNAAKNLKLKTGDPIHLFFRI